MVANNLYKSRRTALGFTEVLKDLVLSKLEEGNWFFRDSISVSINESERRLFLTLLELGYLTEEEFMKAIRVGICAKGIESYIDHIKCGTPPYHTWSPEALGYAFAQGCISMEEAAKIVFDDNKTIEYYMHLGQDFDQKLRNQFERFPFRHHATRTS